MKEHLSHSEIDRIIDEQEHELDRLFHENYIKEEMTGRRPGSCGVKSAALWSRLGNFWKNLFKFGKSSS